MGKDEFHLAVIPDGNRRWSKLKGVKEIDGHKAGVQKIHDVVRWAKELGVTTLSLWVFSTDNASRGILETQALLKLFDMMLNKIENEGGEYKELRTTARIRFTGKFSEYPKSTLEHIKRIEDMTKKNDQFTLIILFSYGGRQEIIDSVNKIIDDSKMGLLDKIDQEKFQSYLYLPEMPDPDLIFRSAGEKRLSGLFPWQSTYSEFYFCDKLWPDVTRDDFKKAIDEFKNRTRRFGK